MLPPSRAASRPRPQRAPVTRVVVGAGHVPRARGHCARARGRAATSRSWPGPRASIQTLAAVEREVPDVLAGRRARWPRRTPTRASGSRHCCAMKHPAIGVVALSPRTCARHAVASLRIRCASGRAYLLAGASRAATSCSRRSTMSRRAPPSSTRRSSTRSSTPGTNRRVLSRSAHRARAPGARAAGRRIVQRPLAERLALSKRAVEKHVGEIFSRLDLHDNPDVSRRVTASLLFLREAGMLVERPVR